MSYAETWKSIAELVGRSERWCRYMAHRAQDPLPVYKIGGIVRIDTSTFDEWLGRQRQNGLASPAQPDNTEVPAGLPGPR